MRVKIWTKGQGTRDKGRFPKNFVEIEKKENFINIYSNII